MSYTHDINRLIKVAEAQGFTVKRTRRGHYQFYAPNKRDIIVASGTPSRRHWEPFMAEMRGAGFRPGRPP